MKILLFLFLLYFFIINDNDNSNFDFVLIDISLFENLIFSFYISVIFEKLFILTLIVILLQINANIKLLQ